jgi:hypothetical protein
LTLVPRVNTWPSPAGARPALRVRRTH